jgi:hypothetical protein
MAREVRGGRGGAHMGRTGVRQASEAERRAENSSEEAARPKTVAAGGASMSGALHSEGNGRVSAQLGRGDGGAVGAGNRQMAHRTG